MNIIEKIFKEIDKYDRVDKLFLSSQTYLTLLENDKTIKKENGNYVWDVPLPIKYSEGKPLWGNIPIEIDDNCHEWAIIGE